ncbi:MAG: maleylacetoacetate isomerase [Saccharospirillum sp.]
MKLYDYWRSSAAYRVRIALNLKGLNPEHTDINLREGLQRSDEYRAVNAAGLVPVLDLEPGIVRQSMAIIEYLDDTHPEPPLLPSDPLARAQVRALALDIACDMHPLNNLRVLNRLKDQFGADEQAVNDWYHHWLSQGFDALERQAAENRSADWFVGGRMSLVDVVLVPQIYNALRFEFDMTPYPRLMHIYDAANRLDAFWHAAPEQCAP